MKSSQPCVTSGVEALGGLLGILLGRRLHISRRDSLVTTLISKGPRYDLTVDVFTLEALSSHILRMCQDQFHEKLPFHNLKSHKQTVSIGAKTS